MQQISAALQPEAVIRQQMLFQLIHKGAVEVENTATADAFQMEMIGAGVFLTGILIDSFIGFNIRIFDGDLFSTELIQITVDRCWICGDTFLLQVVADISDAYGRSVVLL